eukprot:TRINITY_DN18708_c0_g1_i2.p2 TRINITY_DN18708_c0_g1~~TRINITY_DN18708_c0_g1_i2.p2  ORF type:complete len:346 (-),score=12.41 TRINITY_DN18708_c0_g1_i2:146-1150(-)
MEMVEVTDAANKANVLTRQEDQSQKTQEFQTLTRCVYFIKRKQRYCRNRAAYGCKQGYCTKHQPAALEEARKQNEADKDQLQSVKVVKKRVSAPKRMANPLSKHYSLYQDNPQSIPLNFKDVNQPLLIDVGCARGIMLDKLAAKHPKWNFIGIEIRPELAIQANKRIQSDSSINGNIMFLPGNFVTMIEAITTRIGAQNIKVICIQFPDPWHRKKHIKRRIVQPVLVDLLASTLASETIIYLSSDVQSIAIDMRDQFLNTNAFKMLNCKFVTFFQDNWVENGHRDCQLLQNKGNEWLSCNPLGELSEREQVCEMQWRNVWRCLFVKRDMSVKLP